MSNNVHLSRRPISLDLVEAARLDNSTVFIDFDHTLFACNSTELFIADCKPSIFVSAIEFLVRRCVPWRLTRLRNWFRIRDYVCCSIILVLCPWNFWRWKRVAPALFERHVSRDMVQVLRMFDQEQVAIITFGLKFVVAALLRGSEWSSVPLIATPILVKLSYFSRGKLELASNHVGHEATARSTFITDSLDDRDLLAAARVGILVEPEGNAFKAIQRLYFPMRYTTHAKYASSYVLDQFVLVELCLLLVATSRSLLEFTTRLSFIPLLWLSIICVYEIGYFENDLIAARLERVPRLKDAVSLFQAYPILPGAWMWAIATGVLGNLLACWCAHEPYSELLVRLPAWIAGLIMLRLVFHYYNKPDLRIRLHLYPLLQFMKFLPILILVSLSPVGAVLIFCQIATMWAIYLTYRLGGRNKDIERDLYRVVLIVLGLSLMALTGAVGDFGWRFQIIATGLWLVGRLTKAPVLRAIRRRDLTSRGR